MILQYMQVVLGFSPFKAGLLLPTAALSAVVAATDMGKAARVNSTLLRFGGAFGIAVGAGVRQ